MGIRRGWARLGVGGGVSLGGGAGDGQNRGSKLPCSKKRLTVVTFNNRSLLFNLIDQLLPLPLLCNEWSHVTYHSTDGPVVLYYYSVLITVMPRPGQGCVANTSTCWPPSGGGGGMSAAAPGHSRRRRRRVVAGAMQYDYRPCRFRRGSTHEWEAGIDPSFPSW